MPENTRLQRLARNEAERQRRDKYNGTINRLNEILPYNSISNKKLDKISILRLAAAYLRLHSNPAINSSKKTAWRPNYLDAEKLSDIIESTDGIIFIADGCCKLIHVSSSCLNHLGHQDIDMIGHNLTHFIHPSDVTNFNSCINKAKEELIFTERLMSDRIYFRCRMKERHQPRSEAITYQMVQICGYMTLRQEDRKRITRRAKLVKSKNGHKVTLIEPKRVLGENLGNEDDLTFYDQEIVFKGMIEVLKTSPLAELNLLEANLDEYILRMTLDGVILYADHRITMVAGYFPREVENRSAYEFIIPDDHGISFFAHRNMLINSNGTGVIVHRLRTVTGSVIYLQSAGCLQYDSVTGLVDHFVAVIRLLVDEEGDKEREKFVRKFTPHISNTSPAALYQSLQVVIGPKCSKISYQSLQMSAKKWKNPKVPSESEESSKEFTCTSSPEIHGSSSSSSSSNDGENSSNDDESSNHAHIKSDEQSPSPCSSNSSTLCMINQNWTIDQDSGLSSRSESDRGHDSAASSHTESENGQDFANRSRCDSGDIQEIDDDDDFPTVVAEITKTEPQPFNPKRQCLFSPDQLLGQLQKQSCLGRFTNINPNLPRASSAPYVTFNFDSFTQSNGINQPMTGAFVFGYQGDVNQISSEVGQNTFGSLGSILTTTSSGVPSLILNGIQANQVTLSPNIPTITLASPLIQPRHDELIYTTVNRSSQVNPSESSESPSPLDSGRESTCFMDNQFTGVQSHTSDSSSSEDIFVVHESLRTQDCSPLLGEHEMIDGTIASNSSIQPKLSPSPHDYTLTGEMNNNLEEALEIDHETAKMDFGDYLSEGDGDEEVISENGKDIYLSSYFSSDLNESSEDYNLYDSLKKTPKSSYSHFTSMASPCYQGDNF